MHAHPIAAMSVTTWISLYKHDPLCVQKHCEEYWSLAQPPWVDLTPCRAGLLLDKSPAPWPNARANMGHHTSWPPPNKAGPRTPMHAHGR